MSDVEMCAAYVLMCGPGAWVTLRCERPSLHDDNEPLRIHGGHVQVLDQDEDDRRLMYAWLAP